MKGADQKKLKTLNKINIPPAIKSKLRLEAKRWLRFIKEERGELTGDDVSDLHYHYHTGEISFIEFFFNIDKKENNK
jgi:hypothetical protein